MSAFFERTFDTNMKRLAAGSFGGFLASATLLAALFFGEALASEEAYAELARAVALLSILGSAASAGYLAFFLLRVSTGDPGLWAALPSTSRKSFSDETPDKGEDWPLLITLLFRKIPALFAGLAGWVEARA